MLKWDYFWRMLCHTVVFFFFLTHLGWVFGEKIRKQTGWAGRTKIFYNFLGTPFTHGWLNLTSVPSSPTERGWATKVRGDPTHMLALSSAGPALLLDMCVPCVGYMSWPFIVCGLLCMLQLVGVCFWHRAALCMSVLCSLLHFALAGPGQSCWWLGLVPLFSILNWSFC